MTSWTEEDGGDGTGGSPAKTTAGAPCFGENGLVHDLRAAVEQQNALLLNLTKHVATLEKKLAASTSGTITDRETQIQANPAALARPGSPRCSRPCSRPVGPCWPLDGPPTSAAAT